MWMCVCMWYERCVEDVMQHASRWQNKIEKLYHCVHALECEAFFRCVIRNVYEWKCRKNFGSIFPGRKHQIRVTSTFIQRILRACFPYTLPNKPYARYANRLVCPFSAIIPIIETASENFLNSTAKSLRLAFSCRPDFANHLQT